MCAWSKAVIMGGMSDMVEVVIARCASRDTLSRSVGQLERK